MNILSIDSLSKAYGDKTLFEGLSFGLDDGEKVAIIGKNGSGKSTLLKIIAGLDHADSGKAVVRSSARMIYLPQEPNIDPLLTPIEYVLSGRQDILDALDEFKIVTNLLSQSHSSSSSSSLQKSNEKYVEGAKKTLMGKEDILSGASNFGKSASDILSNSVSLSNMENFFSINVWNIEKEKSLGVEEHYEALKDHYEPLKDHYEPLKDHYEPLKDHYDALKDHYEPLKDHYEPLKDHYEALKDHYEPLKDHYEALKEQYDASKDHYDSEREQYDALNVQKYKNDKHYEELIPQKIVENFSEEPDEEQIKVLTERLMKIQDFLDAEGGWDIRRKAEKYLEKLGVMLPETAVKTFSGGEKKRVAIAKALIAEPDFLLLDEPTNHLDVDTVQWLQDVISGFGMTILFITHDRYFLDSVATRILELDEGITTSFPGNYESYLTKKDELQRVEAATLSGKQKKLRSELEWLRRGAKARRSKAKSRIDDISILREETVVRRTEEMDIRPGGSYLGGQILEAHNIVKDFGGKRLIDSFNYVAQPNQRIGIIGKNGSGKSTLLNLLSGELQPDSGYVTIGQTAVIGYFKQSIEGIESSMTVVDNVKMIADHFKYGYKHEERVTAEDLLDRFMFSRRIQRSKASVLSGGELKRLALLRVLIKNPNVLFMDEPTNDFDLHTLAALEDYLDLFGGVLITISHDRAFLDRCVDFIWSFEGREIKEYPGNYSVYLSKKENQKQDVSDKEQRDNNNEQIGSTTKRGEGNKKPKPPKKKVKLSYKEQREYDGLMEMIEMKEAERSQIRQDLSDGDPTDYEKYGELAERLESVGEEIDELEMRWLELSEKVGD